MIKKYIFGGVITLLLVGAVVVPSAQATTTSNEAMIEQIKVLMAKVEELQKQLATIRGEVKSLIKENLAEGMTDADITKLQELLATDPTIYPEGKKTGYFGPLTREAVKRFQARHGLEITGKVDGDTHDMLEEYLKEVYGDKIPAGLLGAPGIAKKVEDRFRLGCEKGDRHGMGFFCKKWKMEHGDDDDEDEMEDEDDDSNDDGFDVEVEIEDGDTTVSFKVDGVSKEVTVKNSTDLDDVLDAVADKIKDGDDASDLDEDLADEIEAELADAEDSADDEENGEFDVEVEVENGDTTVSFTFEGEDYDVEVNDSTDLDDVLDAVADAIDDGDDASDLDEDLADDIENALDDSTEVADAQDAIDEAQDAIDDARDAIDDADGDTEPSDDMVDDAEDKLAEAEKALEDEDYEEAKALANDAENLADDAVDLLDEA